jgi:hypothetical protein
MPQLAIIVLPNRQGLRMDSETPNDGFNPWRGRWAMERCDFRQRSGIRNPDGTRPYRSHDPPPRKLRFNVTLCEQFVCLSSGDDEGVSAMLLRSRWVERLMSRPDVTGSFYADETSDNS